MREEDIKEMIERCHALARKADIYTKLRLIDLALQYEATYAKRPFSKVRTPLVTIEKYPDDYHSSRDTD
jgi:hypothetical protein